MAEIQDLFVFHGDALVRDGPYGADLSNCGRTVIRAPGLKDMSLSDLRRCVRSAFDRTTARKKLRIEALYASVVGGAGETVWQLMKVTCDTSWANYMGVVCNPAAAIYARPMVYVQFVERTGTSGVGGSGEAADEEEPALVSGVGGDAGEEVDDGDLRRRADNFEPNEGVERWWAARIDCHEYLADQVEEVESEEEEDVETASSEDEEDGEAATGGAVGGVVTTDIAYSQRGPSGGSMKTLYS